MLFAIVFLGTVIGAAMTAAGLIRVFIDARREYENAGRRIETMQRLASEEEVESEGVTGDEACAIHAKYIQLYKAHDLVRPDFGNVAYLSAFESKRLMGLVLRETKGDFALAVIGLVVSTAAGVASLWL